MGRSNYDMRNAIGFVIILWALSQYFSSSIFALDNATRESLNALTAAALQAQAIYNIEK